MAALLISAGHTLSFFGTFCKDWGGWGRVKRGFLGIQVGGAVPGSFRQVCLVSCGGERRLDVHRKPIFIPLSWFQHRCYSRGVQGLGRQLLSDSFHHVTTLHGHIV